MVRGDKLANTVNVLDHMNTHDALEYVNSISGLSELYRFARQRFGTEAQMVNEDNLQPFILWPAINREPLQHWLPLALTKLALFEFPQLVDEDKLIITAIPRSATWYLHIIKKLNLFPNASCPLLLKQSQFSTYRTSGNGAVELPVPSYVHNRDPKTHKRGYQSIYFFNPNNYQGATVLFLDDAVAEGSTLATIAEFTKNELGAKQVFCVTPLTKEVQGGANLLKLSPYIAGFKTLITVTKTSGKGQPVEFY